MKTFLQKLSAVVIFTSLLLNVSFDVNAQWSLTGNSSTSSSTNFVGTTDATDFVLRTNNTEYMRLVGVATNTGFFGLGTTTPLAKLHVNNGSLLFSGTTGSTPASGAGTRMIWIPAKAAFRAGEAFSTEWNDANIGDHSTAFGFDCKASGYASFAFGDGTIATGNNSTAFGENATAGGDYSTAFGQNTTASGDYSTAFGQNTTASEPSATAFGASSTASEYGSTAFGDNSIANGQFSLAFGEQTTATGDYSITSGSFSTAIADYSVAMGKYVKVSSGGTNSFVLGAGTGSGSGVLTNGTANSLMVGFNSNAPTLFIGPSSGGSTTGIVSIGTLSSTPSGYKLYVEDGILTERLKVAVDGSGSWSDFVFDKSYKLMPLTQVEKFIDKNKHLPDVPSAKEMVENGLDVAAMDAKLLQKIEELMLYMIETNKQMGVMNKAIEQLKRENETLKSKISKD